jgi:predicted metalloprotease with PDZ domain
VTPFFDAHVRNAAALAFDHDLRVIGLKTRVSWGPAIYNGAPDPDLRIYGWQANGGGGGEGRPVNLIITSPLSAWGRAGLHSRDRLVALNGARVQSSSDLRSTLQALRIGDTVRVEVERSTGPFATTVQVTGFERPTVRLEGTPNALGVAWLRGLP